MKIPSRDADASELCRQRRARKRTTKEGEAERRKAQAVHGPRNIDKRCHLPMPGAERAKRGALAFRRSHRGTCCSERTPQLSPGHASRETRGCGSYPQPSLALKQGTLRPGRNAGGDDARTARERVTNPRAGTALAPPPGVPSRWRPLVSEIRRCITETGTYVNEKGTGTAHLTLAREQARSSRVRVKSARPRRRGHR
jgi:hypothetical protein